MALHLDRLANAGAGARAGKSHTGAMAGPDFLYEGIFRQALVSRGRNRDTAWFSIIDAEWPHLKVAFERWLAPENFDAEGRQRVALSTLTAPILKQRG